MVHEFLAMVVGAALQWALPSLLLANGAAFCLIAAAASSLCRGPPCLLCACVHRLLCSSSSSSSSNAAGCSQEHDALRRLLYDAHVAVITVAASARSEQEQRLQQTCCAADPAGSAGLAGTAESAGTAGSAETARNGGERLLPEAVWAGVADPDPLLPQSPFPKLLASPSFFFFPNRSLPSAVPSSSPAPPLRLAPGPPFPRHLHLLLAVGEVDDAAVLGEAGDDGGGARCGDRIRR